MSLASRASNLPSGLLELVTSTVGDLLVGRAHLGGVDLATTELLLDGIETFMHVSISSIIFTVLVDSRHSPLSR